ncbi:MAG: TOBE domain-containing protein, partial [Alphaproteobacteria bacterium]|nr:TOBE domain-containing protein [Alphaproteobacteria bacterium]
LSTTVMRFAAEVGLVERLGADSFAHLSVPQLGKLTMRLPGETVMKYGDPVTIEFDPRSLHRFDDSGRSLTQTNEKGE